MAFYRLYFMDSSNGPVVGYREFEASSELDAIQIADRWRESAAMELWCGTDKVRFWPARSAMLQKLGVAATAA